MLINDGTYEDCAQSRDIQLPGNGFIAHGFWSQEPFGCYTDLALVFPWDIYIRSIYNICFPIARWVEQSIPNQRSSISTLVEDDTTLVVDFRFWNFKILTDARESISGYSRSIIIRCFCRRLIRQPMKDAR